ncbi:hypothetical protein BGY98DRAFT_937424 [Russula aff. rugulosa BPL654]|nr:hypothetical protein BGY98DRAFT_937424 [Russula aff. rugulosa BPL654]
MKRGAEKQLSKDDNADDEVEEVQTGFQVAKESELERREIRGLPKRRSPAVALVSPPAAPGTAQPGVPQKFGNFSGFGASTGGASSFTLASSPLAGPPQKPADAPAVSESASNATKKFASFLGSPPTAGTKPALSSSETLKQDASGDTDEVALKYYTSLRGLNSCFLSAISKAIDSDPFVDIADLLEQYKKHRVSVQHDYDGKSSHARTQNTPNTNPPSKPSVPAAPISFLKPPGSTPATMPVVPSGFSGFGSFPDSHTSATGFTPSAAGTTNPPPFSLSSTAPASSDPKPVSVASSSPFSFGSSLSPFKSAASHTSKEAESNTPSLNPPSLGAFAPTSTSSPFSLGGGGTSLPSTSSLLFGNPNPPKTSTLFSSDKVAPEEKDKEKDKPASSALPPGPFSFSLAPGASLFGGSNTSLSGSSNIFGASTTTKSADEKDKKDNKEKDKPVAAAPPTSIFGGAPPFGMPSKSPFAFGSAASATTPAQFGFGIAPGVGGKGSSPPPKAGSIGFSFGSPSRTSSQATSTTAPGSAFGFGSVSTTSTSSSGPAAPAGGGTADSTPASTNANTPAPAPAGAVSAFLDPSSSAASRGDTPATEGSLEEDGLARTQSPGLHGGEGEGEEDEETTYTIKAKVFKFTTYKEEAPTWSEMGVGMLRLKKHKETDARRVILRSNTTGKIILNFRIYPGLQPKRTGKTVAFTGHAPSPDQKDTQSVQYRLRVVTEGAATELVEAMEREVRLVQTTPST